MVRGRPDVGSLQEEEVQEEQQQQQCSPKQGLRTRQSYIITDLVGFRHFDPPNLSIELLPYNFNERNLQAYVIYCPGAIDML